MRSANLFLTKDGVLKLGYYGLTTQAECYSIKGTNCEGVRSFGPEVFKGLYEIKSDVWSLGVALLEMMGITPYHRCDDNDMPSVVDSFVVAFDNEEIESRELFDFLKKCFREARVRWSVNELMTVSVL